MTTSPFGPVRIGQALPELQFGLKRLIEDGWTQHVYRDHLTGAFCSLGAIGNDDHSPASAVLARVIRESGWAPSECGENFSEWRAPTVVTRWNDERGRTWEQVHAIWETAIHIAQTFAPTPTPNVTPTK